MVGIQLAARREVRDSDVSFWNSLIVAGAVKHARSSRQFTFTTAHGAVSMSEIAAMKIPQRRKIRKSAVRVPKRKRTRGS
jgi:hypothetical protein